MSRALLVQAKHASDVPAPDVERRLDVLEAEVRTLRNDLARVVRLKPDPVSDAAFLMAVAAAIQGRTFSARELVNHATVDSELRAALRGVTSARRIGKRLHRLADRTVGGLRLIRVDRDRDGTIWCVQVGDLHAND